MPPVKNPTEDFSSAVSALKKNIPVHGKAVLGLSGGPDSVFLFHLCLLTKKTHPFEIIAAHVDHGLRGAESRKDALFTKRLAAKNNCPFEMHKITKKPSGNLEEACRKIRYAFFENIRKKRGADLVLTAHHLNDNIETVIFNLVRGCHLDGLSGMETLDFKRHLLRPLLEIPKENILSYLKKHHIPFRNDASNLDTDFSRNLIRNKVIPELKKINQNLEKTFRQNILNFRLLREKNETDTNSWLKNNTSPNGIPTSSFLTLDGKRQKDLIFHLYKKTYGNLNGLSQNHVKELLKVIAKNRAGLKKEFGPRHIMRITKPEINIAKHIQILKKKAKQVQ